MLELREFPRFGLLAQHSRSAVPRRAEGWGNAPQYRDRQMAPYPGPQGETELLCRSISGDCDSDEKSSTWQGEPLQHRVN